MKILEYIISEMENKRWMKTIMKITIMNTT